MAGHGPDSAEPPAAAVEDIPEFADAGAIIAILRKTYPSMADDDIARRVMEVLRQQRMKPR